MTERAFGASAAIASLVDALNPAAKGNDAPTRKNERRVKP
jgi:hypothetical protein